MTRAPISNDDGLNPAVDGVHKVIKRRGLFSFVSLSWVDPLLRTGYRTTLQETDLPPLPLSEQADATAHVLDGFWKALAVAAHQANNPTTKGSAAVSAPPSLLAPLAKKYWTHFLLACVFMGLTVAVSIILPTQIDNVIDALTSKDRYITQAFVYAAVYCGLQVLNSVAMYTFHSIVLVITMGLRSILVGGIYRKSMVLSPRARPQFTSGQINSLVDVDVPAVQQFIVCFITLVGGLAQVALALYFIARVLGVTTWITAGIYLGLTLLVAAVMPLFGIGQGLYMVALDRRTKRLREFLYGIQSVKYQGREDQHMRGIVASRDAQLRGLVWIMFALGLVLVLFMVQAISLPVLTVIAYSKLGGEMSAANIFAILGLLGALVSPSSDLPENLQGVVAFIVSYKRLSAFMLAEEVNPLDVAEHHAKSATIAVALNDACFTYETPLEVEASPEKEEKAPPQGDEIKVAHADHHHDVKVGGDAMTLKDAEVVVAPAGKSKLMPSRGAFALQNLTLSIPRGSLVCIVGAVGSGKSSMLSALLGNLRKTSGAAAIHGSVAYCPQEPFVTSGTIASNILGLFNGNASARKMQEAIDACCLTDDLNGFPLGTATRVGEKGLTLSGGQRARVALARAYAADADVLLLDDPLAALDARVGKRVFENAICGALKGKTILMVTHQLQLLARSDLVVVLDAGEVVETGTFTDLRGRADSRLTLLMKDYCLEDETDPMAVPAVARKVEEAESDPLASKDDEGEEAEDRAQGAVAGRHIWAYFTACGLWCPYILALLTMFYIALQCGIRVLLVIWTSNEWDWTTTQYFNFFVILGMISVVSSVPELAVILYSSYRAAIKLHDEALRGLANAPMSFFQEQPVGRILNRMTTDVTALDTQMMMTVFEWIGSLSNLLVSLVIVCYSSLYMIAVIVVLGVPAALMFFYYVRSYREVKRLSATMRSPLNHHVTETLNGLSTIAAFGVRDQFEGRLRQCLNQSNSSTLLLSSINFWLGLRLDVLAACVVFVLLMLAGCRVVSPEAIGLALVSTIQLGQALNQLLRNMGTLEASFNSVERLDYYARSLPIEAPRVLPGDPDVKDPWPTQGAIEIRDLEVRYKAVAQPVLSGVSLSVKPGQKIGIVGRSGAGKSTLMAALFRMMEFSQGSIHIDGRDISTLGLHALRQRLHIITQEPILFQGTLRGNVDPAEAHTDAEVWAALETAGLKSHVMTLSGKLEAEVEEGGRNFSAGQRALVCLAATVLAKPTVLVMDEATAAVDAEADARIQACLREQFARTTVLSIAHRVNSIAAFDRVLVMRDGRRAEYDAPYVLLQRDDSEFSKLVKATGNANAALVATLAKEAYTSQDS
ncbi:Multidrug resistance-associated protein 1 [Geranomyces variabilis]|nr:Multidrug resistance-associated protein 1 [Geranomyces variabilis]